MPSLYPQRLSEKLKHVRVIELAYSETEMANALGSEVSRIDVSQFESGTRELPLLLLLRYARLAGLSVEVLIDDEQEIRPNTAKW